MLLHKHIIYFFITLTLLSIIAGCTGGGGGGGGGESNSDDSNSVLTGSVTLTWDPPTESEDGTPLTDLAGYIVYYGTSPNDYTYSVDVGDVISVVISNLLTGTTHYFAVTAYDTMGNESDYSNEFSKIL